MKDKSKYAIMIYTLIVLLAGVVIILIGNQSPYKSVAIIDFIFLILGCMFILLVILEIFLIYKKQTKLKDVVLVVKANNINNKYFIMTYITFFLACMSLYARTEFSIPLSLFLFGFSLFNYSKYISKLYFTNTGIFWAGVISLWKDLTSVKFDNKKSIIEIKFSSSSNNIGKSMLIPFNKNNETEIKSFLNKYIPL